MNAARVRLRPILMTSIAFIAGVAPLAVATGAGAGSPNDIGTGVIGAIMAATARGLFNDIYFQVGLLATIGLSAKNAILIVEFAVDNEKRGQKAFEAAMNAARVRLRPILMTSIAFIAGVAPLAVATGAGAGSQNDIGTGVIGGMLTATILAIFFVPVFFVLVNRGLQHHE